MSVNSMLYLVFFGQVVLLSYYIPRQVLGRVRHVVANYPPSTHPKLYPVSMAATQRAQRTYRFWNLAVFLAGLALISIGIYSPSEEMLGWDSNSVLMIYMLLQYSPMIIATSSGFTYFNLRRRADSGTTRKAELSRRRLFDFVSPRLLALALLVYVAFVVLIIYLRQFNFPWFGGFWNIFGLTVANLLFVGIVYSAMHGKRKDPYQAHEDHRRQIAITANMMVFSSIAATLSIALNVILHAVDLHTLTPIIFSLYCQTLAVIGFRAFQIDNINFDVYREEPAAA